MEGRAQTGLVCVSSIDDYNNGIIKKHEFTRPEIESIISKPLGHKQGMYF